MLIFRPKGEAKKESTEESDTKVSAMTDAISDTRVSLLDHAGYRYTIQSYYVILKWIEYGF